MVSNIGDNKMPMDIKAAVATSKIRIDFFIDITYTKDKGRRGDCSPLAFTAFLFAYGA